MQILIMSIRKQYRSSGVLFVTVGARYINEEISLPAMMLFSSKYDEVSSD